MVESKRTENLTDKFFIYFQILSFYLLPFTLYCLVASQLAKKKSRLSGTSWYMVNNKF
jgi:hypothetical protein